MDKIIERAFHQLYPGRSFSYATKIFFSGHFRQYNASIVKRGTILEIRASPAWKSVNEAIFLGLIQILLVKFFGQPAQQPYTIILYNHFIKNLHVTIPKTIVEKELEGSFIRVNDQFFSGQIELANLRWGSYSGRKLGSYEFQTDTITISKILQARDSRLLDYVMFHEMLHKKLKYSNKKMKNHFHTREFREWEHHFPLYEEIGNELKQLARQSRKKGLVSWINEKFK